jgi:hypothetical protein
MPKRMQRKQGGAKQISSWCLTFLQNSNGAVTDEVRAFLLFLVDDDSSRSR